MNYLYKYFLLLGLLSCPLVIFGGGCAEKGECQAFIVDENIYFPGNRIALSDAGTGYYYQGNVPNRFYFSYDLTPDFARTEFVYYRISGEIYTNRTDYLAGIEKAYSRCSSAFSNVFFINNSSEHLPMSGGVIFSSNTTKSWIAANENNIADTLCNCTMFSAIYASYVGHDALFDKVLDIDSVANKLGISNTSISAMKNNININTQQHYDITVDHPDYYKGFIFLKKTVGEKKESLVEIPAFHYNIPNKTSIKYYFNYCEKDERDDKGNCPSPSRKIVYDSFYSMLEKLTSTNIESNSVASFRGIPNSTENPNIMMGTSSIFYGLGGNQDTYNCNNYTNSFERNQFINSMGNTVSCGNGGSGSYGNTKALLLCLEPQVYNAKNPKK